MYKFGWMLNGVDKLLYVYKSCCMVFFSFIQIPLPFFLSFLDPFRPEVPAAPRGPHRLYRRLNQSDLENDKATYKTHVSSILYSTYILYLMQIPTTIDIPNVCTCCTTYYEHENPRISDACQTVFNHTIGERKEKLKMLYRNNTLLLCSIY